MKKLLLIFIVVALAAAGGFWYLKYYKQSDLTTWSFVPADATFVYEGKNPLKKWKESSEKKIWKNLSNLPALAKVNERLEFLDSISGSNGSVQSFFEENEMLLSFHITSKSSLDALISIEVKNLEQHDFLSRVISHQLDANIANEVTRQYLGFTITELNTEDQSFAYIFYKNFFIGSFTPFLVEDAIRVIEDAETISFKEKNAKLFDISSLDEDQGNLYMNSNQLGQLAGIFSDPLKKDLSSLSVLTESSFLDVAIREDNLVLTGFSLNNPTKGNYLDAFDEVGSSEFEMIRVIPNVTAAVVHYSFDDPQTWHEGLKNYWRKTNPSLLTQIGEVENKYSILASDIYGFMGEELGLMTFQSTSPERPDLVACMEINNTESASIFLNSLAVATLGEDDPYEESWSDIAFGHIQVDELPARLFGPVFSGFPSTFYCQLDGYLFLGNNEQVLRQLIDQVNAEDTWRKSIKVNNFLDIANREANLSLFVNTPGAWNFITNTANENWKQFFDQYAFSLKQVEFAAFQFSNIDGKYYTSIALQHPGEIIERTEASSFEIQSEVEFSSNLITKPFIVRNHNDRSLETITQDSTLTIHMSSSEQDSLWSVAIEGEIVTPTHQLDYYKNGKLQYMFATDTMIHILDRTGTYVPGYPLALPGNEKIDFISLIDYDNSRNYRIMAASELGVYYLFDKNGTNLEGWKGKVLDGKPAMSPFHMRVRSRDYILFMHTNGLVYVLNRRGERVSGFPLDLKGKVDNSLFIQKGGNIADTKLTTVTNDGQIVTFNLEGKFLKREQLYKVTSSDRFQLAISSNRSDFVIARSDDESVTILDSKGAEMFTHRYFTPNLFLKYYIFSSDNKVFVLTDKDKNYTYLYNQDGKVLHALPLETGAEIAMLYFESLGAYKIYKTHGNKLSVVTLNR